MTETSSDRIEKKIMLRAPRSRVWRALTSAEEFGTWFRVKLEGSFAAGKPIAGKITYPSRSSRSAGTRTRSIPRSITRRSRRPWSSSDWRRRPAAPC